MTSNGRHDISLREGFAAFRKLPWVQEAITEALAVAYQIGTEHPLHTTHVVRLHYAFNFNKKHLADQFTLVSGTLLPHAHMSEILTNFSNLVQPLSPSLYSQECLNERGGPAMAAQPALLLRLPLVSTASFSDEVMHITKKRSGTRHSHTILREDPQTHQHLKDSFPTGIMQPVLKDWPRHKQMCKKEAATLDQLEQHSMTWSGRHIISLHDGLRAFRKLSWVQEAIGTALSAAYQIGTDHASYTTHVVRLHFAFNFNKKRLADQFTLISGTLLPHAPMAEILTELSGRDPAIQPSAFSQEHLNRIGGAAVASLPASILRLPLISTAFFADEVLHIANGDSGTWLIDTILREDPKMRNEVLIGLPPAMRPVVVPPPSWDWVGAMRKRLQRKGAPLEPDLKESMAARSRQRCLEQGVQSEYLEELSMYITKVRQTYGWNGPEEES
ncbi:hypothetical protein RQP46_009755 [Phenoliferia psychrophenolica]